MSGIEIKIYYLWGEREVRNKNRDCTAWFLSFFFSTNLDCFVTIKFYKAQANERPKEKKNCFYKWVLKISKRLRPQTFFSFHFLLLFLRATTENHKHQVNSLDFMSTSKPPTFSLPNLSQQRRSWSRYS